MNFEAGNNLDKASGEVMNPEQGPEEPAVSSTSITAMDFTTSPNAETSPIIQHDTTVAPGATSTQEQGAAPSAATGHSQLTQPDGMGELDLPPPKRCTAGSLDLHIRDNYGHPIANLGFRVVVGNDVIARGMTNAAGETPTIENMKIGSRFHIEIKKDAGSYKRAATGTIYGDENYACLQSPKTRFEFGTYSHLGTPGTAEVRKQETIKSHNQKPAETPQISGNPDKKPEIKDDRNGQGNPKASVVDGLRDWYNRNANNAAAPATSSTDLEYVQRLIEFGEKQAKWKYQKKIVSDIYIQQMVDGKFVVPESKEMDGYQNGVAQCTKYVKIALWQAGYNPPQPKGQKIVSIGSNVSPARLMGPELEKAGFRNITNELPDARWAAPGDVIVYKRTAAPNDAGHIDIRTYDGYLSDFLGLSLPIRQFTVTGIYRKHSDLLPEKRMRAFLMVIASREAEQIFNSDGYKETYRALPGSGKFDTFKTHPFANKSKQKSGSASGAYGITVDTWRSHLPYLMLGSGEDIFSPKVQDRIAITIMEQVHNPLALVRQGRIEEAAKSLATRKPAQWPSLPGGDQSRVFTVAEMMNSYNRFFKELP